MALTGLSGDFVGSKVRITVPDGKYEGELYAIDLNGKRVTLEKILSCTTGKKLSGMQNFFGYEIKNIEVIKDNRKKKVDKEGSPLGLPDQVYNKMRNGPFLVTRQQSNPHLKKIKDIDHSKMLLKGNDSAYSNKQDPQGDHGPPITRIKTLEEAHEKVTADQLGYQLWPKHYLVIDKNDNTFREAIIHLQSQSVIGVAVDGVKLGRRGQISFLQVGSRSYVFVFDVLSLGRTLFEEGLKEILEHRKVLKVIHDCRVVSDALFHRYGVKLINVFDTQVADVMVYRSFHSGELPRYVQSLSTLLISHLDFDSDHAYFYKRREQALQSDQKVWLTRPAPQRVLEVAVRHVMYLVALRTALLEAMLQDFTDGVDIYLALIRDAPEEKLERFDQNRHLLPTEFRQVRTSAQRLRNMYDDRFKNDSTVEHDERGFRENCIGSLDTSVIFSHDSVWHQGDGTSFRGLSGTQALQECNRRGTYTKSCIHIEPQRQEPPQDEDEDDCLLTLAEETTKKIQKSAPPERTDDAPPVRTEYPPVAYIPAGCPSRDFTFISRDIRVKEPSPKPHQDGNDSDSDDLIPSHKHLVKSDPSHHAAVETVGGRRACWAGGGQDGASSSGSESDTEGSAHIERPAQRTAHPTLQATLKAQLQSDQRQERRSPPKGRGVVALAMNGQTTPGSDRSRNSDSSDVERPMAGVAKPSPSTASVRPLGRGNLILQALSSQAPGGPAQTHSPEPGRSQGRGQNTLEQSTPSSPAIQVGLGRASLLKAAFSK